MKSAHLSKFVGASLLALSMLGAPAIEPASAQTTTTSPYATEGTTGTQYATRDDGFDWGWLGLLGLLGLAGLAGRKNEEPTRYREPNEVGTPGPRY
jgi:hypothetical protein